MLGGAFSILGGLPVPWGMLGTCALNLLALAGISRPAAFPFWGGGGFIPVVCCVSGVATGAVFLFSFKCSLDI